MSHDDIMGTPQPSEQPRTAAGRAWLANRQKYELWHPIDGRRAETLAAILAIEAEAAMNGWNLHVEQLGDPDRAAFMEGYQAAKDEAAEAAAPDPVASPSEAVRLLRELVDTAEERNAVRHKMDMDRVSGEDSKAFTIERLRLAARSQEKVIRETRRYLAATEEGT